jgi:anaerobic selenocysteine-containing dehydrogenase
MLHYDYDWDLGPEGIIFDKELDIDKLGWKHGDYFKITNINGRAMLVKVDPLVKFLKDGANKNEQMGQVVREST